MRAPDSTWSSLPSPMSAAMNPASPAACSQPTGDRVNYQRTDQVLCISHTAGVVTKKVSSSSSGICWTEIRACMHRKALKHHDRAGTCSAPGMSAAPSIRGGAELEGPAEGSTAVAGAAAAGSIQYVHAYASQQQLSAALKTP